MTETTTYAVKDKQMVEVVEKVTTGMAFGNDNVMEIYKTEDGVSIVGAWTRDIATKEKKLMLVLVYGDGDSSTVREYAPSKLSVKVLRELMDLDGIEPEDIEKLYESIEEKRKMIPVQNGGSGRCSVRQAHQALCDYVKCYTQPGEVFVEDGYGNIRASSLQKVLNNLRLGYSRLELQKNFKLWNLLRTSEAAGHVYTYRINRPDARDWYFSFKLTTQTTQEVA